jgi:hypothetical protein
MEQVAGYYAYPKDGKNLPAIVKINGGGQKAGGQRLDGALPACTVNAAACDE